MENGLLSLAELKSSVLDCIANDEYIRGNTYDAQKLQERMTEQIGAIFNNQIELLNRMIGSEPSESDVPEGAPEPPSSFAPMTPETPIATVAPTSEQSIPKKEQAATNEASAPKAKVGKGTVTKATQPKAQEGTTGKKPKASAPLAA